MKNKKIVISIIIALIVLAILLIPIPFKLNDGGTVEYKSLTYKISLVNQINSYSPTSYDFGVIVEILGTQIYNNVTTHTKPVDVNTEESNQNKESNVNTYNKDFGRYEINNEWVESKEHSTNNKFFYVKKGDEQALRPNNISINAGTNRYKSDEHETFKNAILRQLSMQMSGTDATINANGSYTKNNYVLYTFEIYEKQEDITTTQYYIVGDYKFVLVHETTYGPSEETNAVTKELVDSFKWN